MAAAKPRTHRKSASSKSKRASKNTTKKPAPNHAQAHRVRREIYGVLVGAITLLLTLSLISHRPAGEEHNWIGKVGQVVAEGVFFLFGIGAFGVVALCAMIAARLLFGKKYTVRPTSILGAALVTLAIVTSFSVLLPNVQAWAVPVGGWIGTSIAGSIVGVIGRAGAVLVLFASALIGAILITRASLVEVTSNAVQRVQDTGDRLRIVDGVRAVSGSVSNIFSRTASHEAPPLQEADAQDAYLEPEYGDNDVLSSEALAPETPATPPVVEQTPPSAIHTPPALDAPVLDADALASDVPVHIQSLERSQTPLSTPSPPVEAHAAPVIRPSARNEKSQSTSHASSVAARARRALEAFRKDKDDAPIDPVTPSAPVSDPSAQPTYVADNVPRIPISERADHAIRNPMIDTTRQNAALDAEDLEDPPFDPPSAMPPAAPPPIVEPQRFETDIGIEDAEALEKEEVSSVPEISLPEPLDFDQEEDLQEIDTRPIQILQDDFDDEDDTGAWSTDPSSAGTSYNAGDDTGPQIIESAAKLEKFTSETMERALRAMEAQRERDSWTLPSLDMLSYEESTTEIDEDGLRAMAALLVEALADYKVKGRVTGICPGPVVTRFEFEPEPGTKLSKISGLSTDIAMRLRAENVRIIAPIPGKGCVGVEIPNDIRETVYLKEILADRRFTHAKSKLALALGKDIEGFPVVADLAKMPHLLVAGTTGSGKSVAINSMIMSALYNASPDDVRMILIDPKQLEFALYEDIPHLLLPVVTDPSQAATALQWAVDEMERRYRLMKELRVRNLEGYNEKLKQLQKEVDAQQQGGASASKFALEALSEQDPDGRPTHRHMPYLIVVVDEFADLMMAAGKDVEIAVARIAQKARAAGIHCILATQRPSVDVLTGTIKSNFPTRMSFRLISGTDSRTVIDTVGAEDLLGMGDMLYRPPGSSDLVRVHGAFVDEQEIERVVHFVKEQREAEFDQSILSAQVDSTESDGEVDSKFDDAVEVVLEAGYASISMVQRRLSVGYNRAANIVEEMERRGIIGPSGGGASRREVLI